MARDQRVTVLAGTGLFLSMFLPWYEKRALFPSGPRSDSLTAFGAFSFVEAAVLLVAAAAITLVFARAERRAFHLPGGDGTVVLVAGAWVALLIVWRLFDTPAVTGTRGVGVTIDLQWGIFVALVAAGCLAYAGARMRAAHRAEPPIPPTRERSRLGDEASEVRLPDERPHLDETQVLDRARREPSDDWLSGSGASGGSEPPGPAARDG